MAKQLPQIETASTNLTKVVTAVDQAVTQLKAVAVEAENLQSTIEDKQKQIQLLETEFAEKLRASKVDLGLKIKENYTNVVTEYLNENKLSMLPSKDLVDLRTSIVTIKEAADKEKQTALEDLDRSLHSEFNSTIGVLKAQQLAALAQAEAKVSTLTDKVTFLEDQNRQLLTQLESERQAGVERAKAAQNVYNTYSTSETNRK